LLDLSK